jgi:hypothetical protein
MLYRSLVLLLLVLAASCATDPNEGVFVVNNVEMPKLTDTRLQEIRRVWTTGSQQKSESTKAGRYASYWILDVIANSESTPDRPCSQLELLEIRARDVLISKMVQPHELLGGGKAWPERLPEPIVREPLADRTGG